MYSWRLDHNDPHPKGKRKDLSLREKEKQIEQETVWLTQEQMSVLFDTARSSIAYHIGNIFKEGELNKNTSVENFDRSENKASRPPIYYNLDVIISVGYRVKSKRGVAFRKWANSVLKEYIIRGYAVNHNRMNQCVSNA